MELSKAVKKKQSENVEDRKTNSNGVLITVYEESGTTRSRKLLEDPIKRTKPRVARTNGYDRRALLFAHSQQLRNAGSQNVPLPMPNNQSRPEIKSKRGIPSSSSRCRSSELVASKESKESFDFTPFLCKMKNMLKRLSCKEI